MEGIIMNQEAYLQQLIALRDLVEDSDVWRTIRLDEMIKEEKRKLEHFKRLAAII
jgi:hypothetical protein